MAQLTKKQLELLKKCNGIHKSLKELFNCESCKVML